MKTAKIAKSAKPGKSAAEIADTKAWIISVDMGYGHQRAAYPLKDMANERIITANNDKIISEHDHKLWEQSRRFYEGVSKLKDIPVIGKLTFGVYDQFQKISPFFPFRDLSKPNFSVLRLKKIIKQGLCKSLIDYVSRMDSSIPVVSTHFIPALAFHYNGKRVFCVVTDTDINRVWVPDNPGKSLITYLAPCRHVVQRLRQYGIPDGNIIETGFPLPKENIDIDQSIMKHDLMPRLANLDPNGIFFEKYHDLIRDKLSLDKKQKLDIAALSKYKNHPLTLTYMIGGAGAQSDIALRMLHSLKAKIINNDIRVNIVAGTKLDIKMMLEQEIEKLGLQEQYEKNINIIFSFDKKGLFAKTNIALRTTDILWTKPSEMVFYAALGIPVIIAPPIGAHEGYNREWLTHIGSGFVQENPDYVHDWLFYWLNDGRLADAAIQGFLDAPSMGTYNIESYMKSIQPAGKTLKKI